MVDENLVKVPFEPMAKTIQGSVTNELMHKSNMEKEKVRA